ncbi:MAG: response regulator transcription factor [Solirubrobacterales bacterium]|nr:response regulator transcription factor [Solirubrobacterales bacterium]
MRTTAAVISPNRSVSFVTDEIAALRVFVADDHALYRRVVAGVVTRHPSLTLVGEADDGDTALVGILTADPDVALLDLRMPGPDGLEVCRRIRAMDPDIAVVILTAFDDDDTPARARDAGASACLGKDAGEDEICAALLLAGDSPGPPVRLGGSG